MEKRIIGILCIGCMMLSAAASAAQLDDRWYVVPKVGYVRADVDQVVENSIIYAVSAGKAVTESWNLDLSLTNFRLDPEDDRFDKDFRQTGVSAEALFFFSRNETFGTFAVLAAGMQRTNFGTTDASSFVFGAGLGGQTTLGKGGSALRFELRFRRDNNDKRIQGDSALDDWFFTTGLVIPLGGRASAP